MKGKNTKFWLYGSWDAAWRSFSMAHFRMNRADMEFYYFWLEKWADDAPNANYLIEANKMMKESEKWEK